MDSYDLLGVFTLGEWRVDPALKQLSSDDEVVKIDPRNMRVRQLLASRPGRVISQSEIENTAWKCLVVIPNSVYQSIAQLRRALGEDKSSRRYIETISRKGHCLVAVVKSVAPLPTDSEEIAQPNENVVAYFSHWPAILFTIRRSPINGRGSDRATGSRSKPTSQR
jgi:DNA-binding winged helix-turn-helix (wHTH) protein